MIRQTVSELAESILPENSSFDCALPQPWVNYMIDRNMDPRGSFVWLYDDKGAIFGRPFPLTGEARKHLVHYNVLNGTQFPLS